MFQLRLEGLYPCRPIPFLIPFSLAQQSCLKNKNPMLIPFLLAHQPSLKKIIP